MHFFKKALIHLREAVMYYKNASNDKQHTQYFMLFFFLFLPDVFFFSENFVCL